MRQNFEQACRLLKQKFKVAPDFQTLSSWVGQYSQLCRYERLRPYAVKLCKPENTVEVVSMAHRQVFRFRYHRAKTALMLEEFRNRNLAPLKDYLDNISSETPHQYFQEGERMSEIKSKLDKSEMIVKGKTNYANRLAAFVLQAVKNNKDRHEQLQRFMIANDSVTVATEVPVYIRREDIEYMENILKFKILEKHEIPALPAVKRNQKSETNLKLENLETGFLEIKGKKTKELPRLLTGHIDFVQIRNGQIHLLDYKPRAAKERPVEQLTWYALAISRLTGLRLFDFKCGWFDEKEYFEFYPLHAVKKLRPKVRKNRKIFFKDGTWAEPPKKNELKFI